METVALHKLLRTAKDGVPLFALLLALGCGHEHVGSVTSTAKSERPRVGISGAVRDASGSPVADALVALLRVSVPASQTPAITRSGSDGGFGFDAPAAGTYALTVTAPGKVGAFRGEVAFDGARAVAVELRLGEHGVTYSGRVTDIKGRPIPSALVALFRVSNDRGDTWYVRADASGRYDVMVPSARYAVSAEASGFNADLQYPKGDEPQRHADIEMMPDDVSAFAGPAVVAQLRDASIPLGTCDPHADDLADMAPLARFVADAHLVGLGEGAHGGHEIFQLKHRLFRFLVEKMGFTVLAIEASWPDTVALNDYVLNGKGDPARVVSGMRFWIWDTQEVVDLARWMRSYNADKHHPHKLQFLGFDMQYAPTAEAAIRAYAAGIDRAWAGRIEQSLAPLGDEFLAEKFPYWPASRREPVVKAIADLGRELDQRKQELVHKTSEERWSIARHEVEVLSQFVQLGSDFGKYNEIRDRAMADNLAWIINRQPHGTKVALWAANIHLAKEDTFGSGSMGSLLHERFGKDYVVFATAFWSGSVRASGIDPPRGLMEFTLPSPPPPASVEGTLGRIDGNVIAVNLDALPPSSDAERWSHYRLKMRVLGSPYTESMKDAMYSTRPADCYDAIFLIRKMTPTQYLGPVVPPPKPLPKPENLDLAAVDGTGAVGWAFIQLGVNSGYRQSVNDHPPSGAHSVLISRPGPVRMPGYATLVQTIDAQMFRGRRVRLRAQLRVETEDAAAAAHPFISAENAAGFIDAFESADAARSGASATAVEVTVPTDASVLTYGVGVSGDARVWLDGVTVDVVPSSSTAARP